jgi:acetylornithine deacetylase/succinyl-diaminopimelate desuccinylase-like protein
LLLWFYFSSKKALKAMKKTFVLLTFLLLNLALSAQNAAIEKVRQFRKTNEHAILDEYFEFLAIPNFAFDKKNIIRNAQFIAAMLEKRGIKAKLLPSQTFGTPPAVYGEVMVPGAKRTIVLYAHYDGQPVNPDKWAPHLPPYQPLLMNTSLEKGGKIIDKPTAGTPYDPEWRISCRSSSDDKAGVMLIINAYDALIKSGQKPNCNLKFFFEGEEEIGSLHLGEILDQHQDLLKSDMWVIADGPVHQTGVPKIGFGVRGDVNMDITVFGPKRPLHSGHYGNWAPNPAHQLVRLLASMKDDEGRVLIKDYYKDAVPLSASEKAEIAAVPPVDEQMKKELGFILPEKVAPTLVESYGMPSLNINGIRSADVGENARNVIPTEASVTLDLRQVMGTDYLRQIERVKEHVRSQGFYVIDREPTDEERQKYAKIAKITAGNGGYNAQRTPIDLPIAQDLIKAVKQTTTKQVVIEPTSGGSLPLFLIEKILKAQVACVCLVNHDNNQHAENENVRLQNLWDSMEQLAGVMLMK